MPIVPCQALGEQLPGMLEQPEHRRRMERYPPGFAPGALASRCEPNPRTASPRFPPTRWPGVRRPVGSQAQPAGWRRRSRPQA
eukprot:8248033-Alexandrium_andersonii.AAC.1